LKRGVEMTMYQSNFKIVCQYCGETIDLYDEAYEEHDGETEEEVA
jgi:hypothetical protein